MKVSISPIYEEVISKYLRQYLSKKTITEVDTIPFVLTCAAALESLLNDHIIIYSLNKFDLNEYKNIADGLISIPFLKKLEYCIPLLTDSKYVLDKNCETYIVLAKLIKKRNNMMHNKIFMEDFDAIEENENQYRIDLTNNAIYERYKMGTSVKDCKVIYKSYLELKKLLSAGSKIPNSKLVKPSKHDSVD